MDRKPPAPPANALTLQPSLIRRILIFALPASLLGTLVLLSQFSPDLFASRKMGIAFTLDLLLTIPLVYFLMIRKTRIPKTTVVALMVLGLGIGTLILPKENQLYLDLFKTWVMPILELSLFVYVAIKVRSAFKTFKGQATLAPDFFTAVQATCAEILPKLLVMPLATEIAVFYYGFIAWKKRTPVAKEFSYHQKSGTLAYLGAFIFIIAIETIILHILVVRWSELAAWILTGLSVYTAIQILGYAKSMSRRFIELTDNQLILRYGILNETTLDLSAIESIEASSSPIELNETTRKLSPVGDLENHNIVLKVATPHTLTGLYGMRKSFTTLAFHVDEPEEFHTQLSHAITELNPENA